MQPITKWITISLLVLGGAVIVAVVWLIVSHSSSGKRMSTESKSAELITPSVIEGKAIIKPAPEYPWLAQTFEISGDVAVDVVIDESGNVTAAKSISGPFLLRSAAVDAAYKARFTPTLLSGQPVKVKGLITYRFRLESE